MREEFCREHDEKLVTTTCKGCNGRGCQFCNNKGIVKYCPACRSAMLQKKRI